MSSIGISICIPAYNRPHGLQRLLTSIVEQNYKNYEVIITDDTQSDVVKELIQRWENQLPIRYVKNETSLGSPQNWNAAIKLAKYDWIKLMHDDDWFENEQSLSKFVAAIDTGAHFIFSGNVNFYENEDKKIIELLSNINKSNLSQDVLFLFYKNVIGHPSNTLYKKTDLIYDTQFKWVVDIDFYIQYINQCKKWHYINETLIYTGIDNTTVSSSSYKNPLVEIPEYLNMLQKIGNDFLLNNNYVFAAIWTLIKKFRITNIATIKQNSYSGTIANGVQQIINDQKNIPRLLIKQTPISDYLMKKSFAKNAKSL
jgi:glycosyltransferase involved in cell wall biosynthesis